MWLVKQVKDQGRIVLSVSGRLEGEHLNELQRAIAPEAAAQGLILDLKELRLVDKDVVEFLGDCEARGATLQNCPPYIREWIGAEQASRPSIPK